LCLWIVAVPCIGFCLGEWRAEKTDAQMRRHLLEQSVHAAQGLRPAMVRELSFTRADNGTPAFEFIRRQMVALAAYIPNRGIYSMALRDGRLVFGPESYPTDDPMASPPGTVYEESSPQDFRIFETGKPITFGPITDEYGVFVCALAPVLDPASDEVLMVVGIDVPADNWNAALRTARYVPWVGSLIVVVALPAGIGVVRWHRRRRRPENVRSMGLSADGVDWGRTASRAGRLVDAGLLVGMGVLGVIFLVVVLLQTCYWTYHQIDSTAEQEARLAVELDRALRNYVSTQIRPEMDKRVERDEFIPQAMSPSFAARSIFDGIRETFPDVILRLSSTNPRNPANMTMPSEASIIRYFEEHPEADIWSGVMRLFGTQEKYFVCAVPRRFNDGCLRCHGRPEDAPASLRTQYGSMAGFGRSVGEVSVDLAAVPVNASYLAADSQVCRHMLVALVLCVVFLAGIAFLIWADARRRRCVEIVVEKQRNFLRLVIDSIPDFVCVKSQDGRLVLANKALAKVCDCTAQDLECGHKTIFSLHPEQVGRWRRNDQKVMAAKESVVLPEEPVVYPNGTTRWFTATKVPLIGDDGDCRNLLLVASDITEMRQARREQESLLQQVHAINEELTHFAYVVSHDLKAPLRGIKLVAEWLCADYGDTLCDDAKEQLDLLRNRVDRMHNLIEGILQYSRVGRIREETSLVDFNTLVPNIVDGLAVPEHIHVVVESELPVVTCERTRISQVFQNLLSNAAKYMDKPVGEIRVGCVEDGEFWRFSVADNGPGIEERYFERIFKLFQTLTPRDEFESTGVGLALVKKIVEMYGGRVWVESQVGSGSTFFFTYPRNCETHAPMPSTGEAVCACDCAAGGMQVEKQSSVV